MREIARRAGVAPITVSRALSNPALVSEALRARIMHAVAEAGFIPDRVAGSMRSPGRIITQVIETPDGARYFTLARTVARIATPYAGEDSELAVGLGCELKYAERLTYSRGLNLSAPIVTPIGPACRICERPACPQRAAEPLGRTLTVDDFTKSITPYPFAAV